MTDAPFHTDMHLLKLSHSDDPKIKANCARTLQNMTSDAMEALEEGAVANLIAISLDGKEKTVINEDFDRPVILAPKVTDDAAPSCAHQALTDTMWHEERMLVTGGPAGKGPDPPLPPNVDHDDPSEYIAQMDAPEGAEADAKTKMAFAKMQAPQGLRDACTLTDADFENIRDDRSDDGDGSGGQTGPDPFLDDDNAEAFQLGAELSPARRDDGALLLLPPLGVGVGHAADAYATESTKEFTSQAALLLGDGTGALTDHRPVAPATGVRSPATTPTAADRRGPGRGGAAAAAQRSGGRSAAGDSNVPFSH